jgi:hypothetical protein
VSKPSSSGRGFGDRPVVLASSIFLSTSASLCSATAAKGDCFALFLNLLKPKPLGNSPLVHHIAAANGRAVQPIACDASESSS